MTKVEFEIEKNALENLVYANHIISCEKCCLYEKYNFDWNRHADEEGVEEAKRIWLALEETNRFFDEKIAKKRKLLETANFD